MSNLARIVDRRRLLARRAGFSLVEVLISMSLLGGLLGTLLMVVSNGSSAARVGMARSSIEGSVRRTLERVASLLVSAGAETLDPDPVAPWGSQTLTFQTIEGFDGEIVWGLPQTLALVMDLGETDDGRDEDGDGLIDERALVHTRAAGSADELSTTLIRGVRELAEGELANDEDDNENGLTDEQGLSFVHTGGRLLIRLTLEDIDSTGNSLIRTAETSVRLRN